MKGWVYILHMNEASRPGILERMVQTFASRAINLESVLASAHQAEQDPVILLRFQATEQLQEYLQRCMNRFAEVDAIEVIEVEPSDPRAVWEFVQQAGDA